MSFSTDVPGRTGRYTWGKKITAVNGVTFTYMMHFNFLMWIEENQPRADNEFSQNNPDRGTPPRADKSAVGAINRPLRMDGLFRYTPHIYIENKLKRELCS